LLASGSDDLRIIVWDPFKRKEITRVETKHRGNIFGIKYLPFTNDSLLASGAADRDIYVNDMNKNVNLYEIHAHQNRVKRLETAPNVPFLFWSCGEDGLVL
jgi:WD and tetratricopeptide repeats protein 1